MTQHQLIIEYIKLNGEILPAKMAGAIFMGTMFGSETSKRCRELRSMVKGKWENPYGKQMLDSRKEGRFEVFYLYGGPDPVEWFKPQKEQVGTIAGPYINQIKRV